MKGRGQEKKKQITQRSLKINSIYLKFVTQEFLGDLKNSKWRIQYGVQVILINFYKPQLNPDSCSARKMPSKTPGAILFPKPMHGCVM